MKKEINIKINVFYGSDFQEECFEGMLKTFLEVSKNYFISKHKKNKMEIKIYKEDEEDFNEEDYDWGNKGL